ncbi:hypothetical protein lerEdw1_020541 [Lerista edwardsae]|nr:hypothetical protein lerEdw1_020541 [Lerista edwardsae]
MKRIKPRKSEFSWTVFPASSSHRGRGVPVDMILKRVFFVLHLGVILPVTARQTVYAIAGKPYTLPCQSDDGSEAKSVVWKYETKLILRYLNAGGKPYKGVGYSAYDLEDADKGKFSLVIPDAVAGCYTCEAGGKQTSFDLHVLSVTGTHNGYLLEGETLELKLDSSDRTSIKKVEWYSPRKAQLISNKPRWTLKNNNWTLQIMNLSFQEDNGIWECRVLDLNIPYDVKVLGFQNPSSLQLVFAAVNSNVTLSYPLSVKLQDVPGISAIVAGKLTEDNRIDLPIPINASSTFPVKNIPNVQFGDAGQYLCQLRLNRRTLNKSIHLVVMKVSLQTTLKEANLSLCCHISAPIHLMGRLQWSNLNTIIEERANPFCVSPRSAGLWTCSLLVDKDVKIRINYTVTVAEGQVAHHTFPVLKVTLGVVGPLLLLILTVEPMAENLKEHKHIEETLFSVLAATSKEDGPGKGTFACKEDLPMSEGANE